MGNVNLITAGDKVGMSEATLLNMLGISPFTYGLQVTKVYDSGSIFDPTILDITDEDLKAHVLAGIRNIAALSLKIGYPTVASVPHSIINGMKNCMALAAVTDITFKEAETMKAFWPILQLLQLPLLWLLKLSRKILPRPRRNPMTRTPWTEACLTCSVRLNLRYFRSK